MLLTQMYTIGTEGPVAKCKYAATEFKDKCGLLVRQGVSFIPYFGLLKQYQSYLSIHLIYMYAYVEQKYRNITSK